MKTKVKTIKILDLYSKNIFLNYSRLKTSRTTIKLLNLKLLNKFI